MTDLVTVDLVMEVIMDMEVMVMEITMVIRIMDTIIGDTVACMVQKIRITMKVQDVMSAIRPQMEHLVWEEQILRRVL